MITISQRFKAAGALVFLVWLVFSQNAIATDTSVAKPCCQQSAAQAAAVVELPQEAIQKLRIDAGFGWGIFSGSIFNGNENYHLKQLVVSMTPIHDGHAMHGHENMSHEPKVHQINLDIPPASKGALSMPLPNDDAHVHDFKWHIIKVMGYQTP